MRSLLSASLFLIALSVFVDLSLWLPNGFDVDSRWLALAGLFVGAGGWFLVPRTAKETPWEALDIMARGQEIFSNSEMVDALPLPIYCKDREGRYTVVNAALEIGSGFSRSELLGKRAHDVFPEPIADQLAAQERKILEEGGLHVNEQRLYRRTGEALDCMLYKWPLKDRAGNTMGLAGCIVDITGTKQVAQELRESEERFRVILGAAPDGIITHQQGVIRDCNPQMLAMVGLDSNKSVVGRNLLEFVPEALRGAIPLTGEENREQRVYETTLLHADGSEVQVEVRSAPVVLMGEGYRVAFVRNITERVARNKDLRRLFHAVENNPAAIIISDTNGRVEYVNRCFEEMSGYSLEEVQEHIDATGECLLLPSGRREEVFAALQQKGSWHSVHRIQKKNGESYWERMSLSTILDDRGKIAHIVGNKEDVTSQIASEQALRNAKEKAEIASRTKSEFLANMSHELRTPLNAIIGFSELIRRELYGPLGCDKYREYLRDIHDSGNLLLDLINDLLDLSKIEAGEMVLQPEPVDLSQLVRSATRILKPKIKNANQSLILDVDEELPVVRADHRAMLQILNNLLSNAHKFTHDDGTIILTCKRCPFTRGVELVVQDNGRGVASEKLDEILQPFSQVDSSLTRAQQGTGLGLAITSQLVELQGGTFRIESELGQGFKAFVCLPEECLVGDSEETEPSVDA
ncbi:sensor histidine kinase [Kiloniella sp. b19]|uniref:sensor histidine kinase n=1 Tax=Kiloniella sp. GXU_MW_B19 TaxID=3141326 RepID=UPI0031DF17EC